MKIRFSVVFKSKEQMSRTPVRCKRILAARAFVFALLLCLGSVQGWAQQNDQQQMRGLDEQVQEIKSDVLSIAAELSQLEEKLLYPSGTQVAVFIALAKGDQMRLDAVRIQIDGQLVSHHIYSFKELEALRKGGVQRIYVGNVTTGDHKLEVLVDGKLEGGADFSRTERFTFRKEVKPKMVELTLAGSGNTPIALGEF
jgi:cell division protein FtsB